MSNNEGQEFLRDKTQRRRYLSFTQLNAKKKCLGHEPEPKEVDRSRTRANTGHLPELKGLNGELREAKGSLVRIWEKRD